ncbi:hypothetical protein Dsin_026372 [Dipteronia sinensis]|uniref:Uncharacterized protein n=1 Tax=Dipteronia sinensis TaxID=43782 RepID=A0AAE0DXT4_9ROSI|nr:hypothetical protein Dsin_026372 [Dipteronia sinensis]
MAYVAFRSVASALNGHDSYAQPKKLTHSCNSKPPFSFQFWNMVANVTGFIIPLLLLFGSHNRFVPPAVFHPIHGPFRSVLAAFIGTGLTSFAGVGNVIKFSGGGALILCNRLLDRQIQLDGKDFKFWNFINLLDEMSGQYDWTKWSISPNKTNPVRVGGKLKPARLQKEHLN